MFSRKIGLAVFKKRCEKKCGKFFLRTPSFCFGQALQNCQTAGIVDEKRVIVYEHSLIVYEHSLIVREHSVIVYEH
jgi:hypothetical protein